MKTLCLIRHAKAIPSGAGVEDFTRPLTKRGRHDADTMSKRVKKRGILPDVLVSSPADRAIETAHIFAERFEYPRQNILLKSEIYDEDDKRLSNIIQHFDDTYSTIFLFGHEPTLSQVARFFLHDFDAELRTSGVIGITFEAAHWREIETGSGQLAVFDFPAHRA